ncbi:uncharacterized protein LOC105433306 [Pogonomyrmex barbatus]|uniref:Uncharacterized protein LOC105433306 n=1 Tax=Pogonomyrmex barbatus TaxID=144034 RepID=A0A6I9X2Q8_9HYME|nr:uncharacterized protein LOC105433306 [Pogonomyrmex barbatus]
MVSNGTLPRVYDLSKIHKQDFPFRLIVSCVDSPLYALASSLNKLIMKSIPKSDTGIDNSFQLIQKLSNVHIDDDFSLISLDVKSLFTNVPFDLGMDSISKRWDDIAPNCDIPKEEFLKAIYKQTFGLPMGSPLSPIIADLVMRDLEEKAVGSIDIDLPFYYRYVDDIALAVPHDKIKNILGTFNSFHPHLQFICEIGGGELSFLEITMKVVNGVMHFDWYHKPTFSRRYLSYLSQHPLSQKRGIVYDLVGRAFSLSHLQYQQKNLESAVSTLLSNDYPLNLNRLERIIRAQKDKNSLETCKTVVYKIECDNCEKCYVEQTKRQLKTRLSEHRSHIRRNTNTNPSLQIILDSNHDFSWDKVKILNTERDCEKRLISEMLFIKLQKDNTLNLQIDTECLHHSYVSVLDKL